MILRNYVKWNSIINYDYLNHSCVLQNGYSGKVNGFFLSREKEILVFYYLLNDFIVSDGINNIKFNQIKKIKLTIKSKLISCVVYTDLGAELLLTELLGVKTFKNDFTQTDLEDFSLLIFIYNVFHESNRRERLKELWK